MTDQLLRDRMDRAVAGIRPTSRLDEILAGPRGGTVPSPKPSRQTPRRTTLMAVAAALVLLAAFAAGWLVRNAGRDTTHLEIAPVTTTGVGSTTTSDGPRLGSRASVLTSTLPTGMRLIDERPSTGESGFGATLRFAREEGPLNGDGPYLVLTVTNASDYGTQWADRVTGDVAGRIAGHDAYRTTSGPALGSGWTGLAWANGPDEVVEIQSKGIDDDTVLDIARSVRVQP
jgi:hypothetical protein